MQRDHILAASAEYAFRFIFFKHDIFAFDEYFHEIVSFDAEASPQLHRYYYPSQGSTGLVIPVAFIAYSSSFSFFFSDLFTMPARPAAAFTTLVAADMIFLFPFTVSTTVLTVSLMPSTMPSIFLALSAAIAEMTCASSKNFIGVLYSLYQIADQNDQIYQQNYTEYGDSRKQRALPGNCYRHLIPPCPIGSVYIITQKMENTSTCF